MSNFKVNSKSPVVRLLVLVAIFAAIVVLILLIRTFSAKPAEYTDNVAEQIKNEMSDSSITLSTKATHRITADFYAPIIQSHGGESRLIVYTATITETMKVADEGLGGWKWTSSYQDIEYEGSAQYTVDLSQLSEDDFIVDNETKTLIVKIPYAVLSPISITDTKFYDVKRGWAASKDIKLTPEENDQLINKVKENIKTELIDDNYADKANESAKSVVADLLATTVKSVDPEFSVIVMQ